MPTHFTYLKEIIPDLKERNILDLGAGKGKFVVEATKEGAHVTGIEMNADNVSKAHVLAQEQGVSIQMVQGDAMKTPFKDGEFSFLNLCEVIEHVDDTHKLLTEMNRLLSLGGLVYISVPNRFGMKDQHFHMYFLNWMPRSWAHRYIGLRKRHKSYDSNSGLQRIDQMHYFTFSGISKLVRKYGFDVHDGRVMKIKKRHTSLLVQIPALILYFFLKQFYFDSFHLILKKNSSMVL